MIYNYQILNSNNQDILYLYLNEMEEFSQDLDNKVKPQKIFEKINNYIQQMGIIFNGEKIVLIENGLVIGTLNINNSSNDNNKKIINYQEHIILNASKEEPIKSLSQKVIKHDGAIVSNFVKMKDKNEHVIFVDLNNYIINELVKIIPPTYADEAIKSLAVIIRTKILKDLYENKYLNGDTFQPIYKFKKIWKENYTTYLNKYKEIVDDTNYQFLSKNNYYYNFNDDSTYTIPFSIYKANDLANKGYDYLKILGHFYPSSSIEMV